MPKLMPLPTMIEPRNAVFELSSRIRNGGRLICSDASEAMLETARHRAAAQGLGNVDFERLELEWIDLPTHSAPDPTEGLPMTLSRAIWLVVGLALLAGVALVIPSSPAYLPKLLTARGVKKVTLG